MSYDWHSPTHNGVLTHSRGKNVKISLLLENRDEKEGSEEEEKKKHGIEHIMNFKEKTAYSSA